MKGPLTALADWARPRRWSILGEAALAVALVLVAVPVLLVGGRDPEPVAVVTAYLEALREGDVERAETYTAEAPAMDVDRSWLTAAAMSGDWQIASVELKSASQTTVHAAITAGGRRAEGAFRLEGEDGDLRIANPYLYLTGADPLFASLEIGGVRGEVEHVDGAALPVALYPGSYALFPSVPELADALPLLALPDGADDAPYGLDSVDVGALTAGPLSGGEAVEARLNEGLAALLDACAASADLAPAGCPFSAAYEFAAAYDGRTEFDTVAELDWSVAAYPRVRFDRDLRLEVVEPGWMALSGKGTALLADETDLDGRCGVDVANLVPALGEDGTVAFTLAAGQANTC